MSEPRLLLIGPALDAAESAQSLENLEQITLPNVTKIVITLGKFDARGEAKPFNVEVGYPGELPHLQTLAAWAELPDQSDQRFRDGHALFCLRSFLARDDSFDFAAILREPVGFQERWPDLRAAVEDRLFLVSDHGLSGDNGTATAANVLFDLGDKRAAAFLDLAWELYISGAVYGMAHYSFDHALTAASDALRLVDQMERG